MTHAIDNQIRSYSHGMKQKICIIAALIHKPKLWVLDEPLMGLDPQSAYEIKCYMKEHKAQGNTVFFSSHNIDMVEKLCDRVAIINKGELIEIIDIPYFMEHSKVSLEEYFLNLTKSEVDTNLQIAEENQKSKKERRKDQKLLEKEEKLKKKQNKDSFTKSIKNLYTKIFKS
jgi:ABC-type multidrug transport system ATPase subunit